MFLNDFKKTHPDEKSGEVLNLELKNCNQSRFDLEKELDNTKGTVTRLGNEVLHLRNLKDILAKEEKEMLELEIRKNNQSFCEL